MEITHIMKPITCIGGGNMARCLIGGLLKSGVASHDIRVADPKPDIRQALSRDFGITTFADNVDAIVDATLIILAVKPQTLPTIGERLGALLKSTHPLLLSVAAGVRLDQLRHWFGQLPIVRCMSNTPAALGAAATALCANVQVTPAQRVLAQRIFDAVGLSLWVEEETLMDTVTALSGSGPAYFFTLAGALEDAATAQGLPRETARTLINQTCLGAGRMLTENHQSSKQLRHQVTSPGGATQAALKSFATHQFSHITALALAAATQRSGELADALEQDEPL